MLRDDEAAIKTARDILRRASEIIDRTTLIAMLSQPAELSTAGVTGLVGIALDGDEAAHAALCSLGKDYLHRGEVPPYDLATYLIGVLDGRYPSQGKRGKKAGENFLRDVWIARAIDVTLARGGYEATRSQKHTHSACSIVCEAGRGLPALRMPAEDEVNKIWLKYSAICSKHT